MSTSVPRILFLAQADCPRAVGLVERLRGGIQMDFPRLILKTAAMGENTREDLGETDVVVATGGDGTLLQASALFLHETPLFVPIGAGTVGFMMSNTEEEGRLLLRHAIDNWAHRASFRVLERMRLSSRVFSPASESPSCLPSDAVVRQRMSPGASMSALNEISISRGMGSRPVTLTCEVDGVTVSTGPADGLVISTPSGSSAYALSAGGALIDPRLRAISMVSVCPRSLTSRPALVLPHWTRLRVSPASSRHAVYYATDGFPSRELRKEESLVIECHPHPLRVLSARDEGLTWLQALRKGFSSEAI
jgi:NAD+ kinase